MSEDECYPDDDYGDEMPAELFLYPVEVYALIERLRKQGARGALFFQDAATEGWHCLGRVSNLAH